MTTQTFTSVIDNTSTAGFRAWGSEFGVNLAVVGLVQTADTGQINWTTVTLPGLSTVGGYEIWRFADSSLFMKFEYGTGSVAGIPQMWVTVGTGSNGSGAITGQTNTRNIWTVAVNTPTSTATLYTSYMCRVADAFAVLWKANSTASSLYPCGFLVVGKTVDGTGAATTIGFGVLRQNGSSAPQFQSVRIASTAATFNESQFYTVIPGNPSSSLVGVDLQAYMIWMNVPQVLPFNWATVALISEVPKLNTFTTTMVGLTAHTYMNAAQIGNLATINGQSATVYGLTMIYE